MHQRVHDCACLIVLEVARVTTPLLLEGGSQTKLVAVHPEVDKPVSFGFYDKNESRC